MTTNLYSSGKFGIVDPFYRHIWVNVYDEEAAHNIKKVFWSKAPSIIVDLTQFANYSETLIDSSVSLNWKIPLAPYSSKIVSGTPISPLFQETQTSYYNDTLINEPNHSHLPLRFQKEIQQQMLLYFYLMVSNKNLYLGNEFINQVNQIFQSNLFLNDIKTELYKFANSLDDLDFRLSWIILTHINSLYE